MTVAGATYTVNSGPLPCSANGGAGNVSLKFVNESSTTIHQWWVATDCKETSYGAIAPMASDSRVTFVGHRWRIRREDNEALLFDFTINGPGPYVVTFR